VCAAPAALAAVGYPTGYVFLEGAAEIGVAKIGAVEVGNGEVGAAEIAATEIGAAKVGTGEVGTAHIGFRNVCMRQIRVPSSNRFTCSDHRERGLDVSGRRSVSLLGSGVVTHE